jgi:hypothetical protein
MVLNQTNIAHYLTEHDLLSWQQVVDGDFVINEASRRNRNFFARSNSGPSYFIKQVRQRDPQTINAIRNEAAVYRRSVHSPGASVLKGLLPQYHLFDPENLALVLDLLPGASNLYEYLQNTGQMPAELPSRIGTDLASLGQTIASDSLAEHTPLLPRTVPWILTIHKSFSYPTEGLRGGNMSLLEAVNSHADFANGLEEALDSWQCVSFTHGDIRLDNWVICQEPGNTPGYSLKLIDWELAGLGDPLWDAGSMISAYLSYWILVDTASAGQGARSEHHIEGTTPSELKETVQAFWTAYQAEAGQSVEGLETALCYAGARLIQTAFEHLQPTDSFTIAAHRMMDFSRELMNRPLEAGSRLFNLEAG